MIEVTTKTGIFLVEDGDATCGNYGIVAGDCILKARVFDTTSVPDFAFYGQTDLESVIIEVGVERIGKNSFQNTHGLKDISFPSTIASVEHNSFEGCPQVLVDSLPPHVKELLSIAKNNHDAEIQKRELAKRKAQEAVEKQKAEWAEECARIKAQKEEAERQEKIRKQQELEAERQRREEARIPRNEFEQLLLRLFESDVDLSGARVEESCGEYRFEVPDVICCSERNAEIHIRLADEGSGKPHSVGVHWYAWTTDLYDFEENYCEEVENFRLSLEKIGMTAVVEGRASRGKEWDDYDSFALQMDASKELSSKGIEKFLNSLKGVLDGESRKSTRRKGANLRKAWFPMLRFNSVSFDWREDN